MKEVSLKKEGLKVQEVVVNLILQEMEGGQVHLVVLGVVGVNLNLLVKRVNLIHLAEEEGLTLQVVVGDLIHLVVLVVEEEGLIDLISLVVVAIHFQHSLIVWLLQWLFSNFPVQLS